jgi:hypothetical protein
MPGFVFGVGRAEPPLAGVAVIGSRGVARFIHWRYRLAGASYFSGFCLILLLQHGPSHHEDSTRVFAAWVGQNLACGLVRTFPVSRLELSRPCGGRFA